LVAVACHDRIANYKTFIMKRALLLLTALFSFQLLFAQIEITGGYSMGIPRGKMNDNINLTHTGTLQGIYRMPFNKQLWAGVQLGLGGYAYKTERQTYRFRDGSTTVTDVNFSSNVFNGHGVIGFDLTKSSSAVVPYITAKGGISNFYTRIFIEDPHDVDGCRPIENRNMFKDATFSYGAGLGARLDGKKFFKSRSDNWAIDVSVNYLTGGTLDYLNVRHLQSTAPVSDGKEFTVKFVNVTTNEIHEHKVAQVYTSKLQQVDVRVGFSFKL
jgi:hypothetical protein